MYVLYDDIANRWYVTALDGTDTGLLLAVSNDSNPWMASCRPTTST